MPKKILMKRTPTFIKLSILSALCLSLSFLMLLAELRADQEAKNNLTEKRTALIIGNGNYKTGRLFNPENDANDMAALLEKKGFTVTLLVDVDQKKMERSIRRFGKTLLKDGGVGLFFYAGHGIQVSGVNYLIPIGAEIEEEDEIKYEAVDANMVLSKMHSAGNRLNMVLLDACRDNPYARSFRSSSKGLARMDAPRGTLISYATAPGNTASDGSGRNGLFTGYLLKYMNIPGMELTTMMKNVRREVRAESENKQVPWDESSLEGDFYFTFKQKEEKSRSIVASGSINDEEEFWSMIKPSTNVKDFEEYLEAYPDGRFTRPAELRMRQLKSGTAFIDRGLEQQSSNQIWHISAIALILVSGSQAIEKVDDYNSLSDDNSVIKTQYDAAYSVADRSLLEQQYEKNQGEMENEKNDYYLFTVLTLLAVSWEGYLLWNDYGDEFKDLTATNTKRIFPKLDLQAQSGSIGTTISWRFRF